MLTRVDTTPDFDKEIERLARKYPAVFDVTEELITQIEGGDRPGDKIRGVVYYVESQYRVILITIYSKTERANIRNVEIRQIITGMD